MDIQSSPFLFSSPSQPSNPFPSNFEITTFFSSSFLIELHLCYSHSPGIGALEHSQLTNRHIKTNKQKPDSPSPTSHQMLTASLLVVRWHISLPHSMLLSGWSFRLPWALWVLSKFLGVCVSGKHFSSKSFIVSSSWTLFFKWLIFGVSYECLFQDCTLYNL